jgi:hypothetical protein
LTHIATQIKGGIKMAIKKQVFVMSVVFNEEETYAESAVESISHRLFNEDGIIEWDFKITKEEVLSADITEEDLSKKYEHDLD